MWYHGILPTMGIITGCLISPVVINYYLMKLDQNGNAYRRDLTRPIDLTLYWRDIRLSGNPYVMTGLNNIPDTDEEAQTGGAHSTGGKKIEGRTGVSSDPAYHTTPCPPEDK